MQNKKDIHTSPRHQRRSKIVGFVVEDSLWENRDGWPHACISVPGYQEIRRGLDQDSGKQAPQPGIISAAVVVPGLSPCARSFRRGALCRRGGIERSSRSGRWMFRRVGSSALSLLTPETNPQAVRSACHSREAERQRLGIADGQVVSAPCVCDASLPAPLRNSSVR
jgi:hypothetical protein